jgi:ribosomal protein L37AE/L43A
MNHFGVKWKVLYGGFLGTEPYAFADGGPYCPECDYEMEAEKRGMLKKYYWKCDHCGKIYKCPVKHPYDAGKIVERLLESEVRSGRLRLNI